MTPRVLIIETEMATGGNLASWLKRHGCQVHEASHSIDARKVLREREVDVIVAVLNDCRGDSLSTLRKLKGLSRDPVFILVTRPQNVRLAIEAMKLGARDVLPLPVDVDLLLERISNASVAREDAGVNRSQRLREFSREPLESLPRVVNTVRLKKVRAGTGIASFLY